jgi:hypothetical protein
MDGTGLRPEGGVREADITAADSPGICGLDPAVLVPSAAPWIIVILVFHISQSYPLGLITFEILLIEFTSFQKINLANQQGIGAGSKSTSPSIKITLQN